MIGKPAWVLEQQSGIAFDELTSLVAELVSQFEQEDQPQAANWTSDNGRTSVIKHGSSACLYNVLNQMPDTVLAEYEVLYRGHCVFSWCEYLWPQLSQADSGREDKVYLPEECLDELLSFHQIRNTAWLRRYHAQLRRNTVIEIDEIDVMTKTNHFQVL